MKKLFWILFISFGISVTSNAQSAYGKDSVKCFENLYIYYELAKNKAYDQAWEGWLYVFENCPGASKNTFIYGPPIVETKIKSLPDGPEKEKYKAMLMQVYDQRLVYYPGKEGYVKERKALDMAQHFPDSNEASFKVFKEALEIDQEHSAAFYNSYFIVAARLFNDKVFTIGDVFQAYNVVAEGLEFNNNELNREIKKLKDKQETSQLSTKEEKALAKAERELERYDNVESNVEKVLGPISTCDKLQTIYNEETFTANQSDPVWLRRAVKMLSKERKNEEGEDEDCTDDPIFFRIAEAVYKLDPSAPSARAMAKLAAKKNDYTKSLDFYKEAVDQEVDPKKQAVDYYRMAIYNQKLGRLSTAKSLALKAASLRKGWGDPYILVATVYAQADGTCGANVFEKKAVYWAAIDKLNYAKSIDGDVAGKANRLINAYKGQIPAKNVSFQLSHNQGEKYTIGCWINETITADWNL